MSQRDANMAYAIAYGFQFVSVLFWYGRKAYSSETESKASNSQVKC